MIEVKITGDLLKAIKATQKLKRGITTDSPTIQKALKKAANESKKEIEKSAKSAFSNRSTGKLARSFKVIFKSKSKTKIELLVASSKEYAKIQEKGGTIRAKKSRYLAIPITPTSRKRSPRSWGSRLFFIETKAGKKLLVTKRGKKSIRPHYVLKPVVRIKGKHYLKKAMPGVLRVFRLTLKRELGELVRKASTK